MVTFIFRTIPWKPCGSWPLKKVVIETVVWNLLFIKWALWHWPQKDWLDPRDREMLEGLIAISVQFSSATHSCPTVYNPMNRSMPGLPVHHQLPEFTQTRVHRVGDAIQPSHPLSSPSPPAPNPSQHQGLFQWVSSSHEVAKVLELQLQHQSFQWTSRTDLR